MTKHKASAYDVVGDAIKALRSGPVTRNELFEAAGLSETTYGTSGKRLWVWLQDNGFAVASEQRKCAGGFFIDTITLSPSWRGQEHA